MLKTILHPGFKTAALLGLITLPASWSSAAVVISDSFESNTAADYTVVNDGTPNGTTNFNFNYIGAGIPLAPRSAPGSTGGLRMTANDSATAVDALTAFHKTSVAAPNYILTVDVYMAFSVASGSTEYAHVGVGGNGTIFNSVFTPISGSGSFIAFTGDGGSASDYRWYRDAANTPIGETDSTTLPNTHPSYLGNGSNNTNAFYTTLFPLGSRTAPSVAGSPGNMWTTVKIEVNSGTISYFFNNTLTFQGQYAGNFNGFASLGISDPFTSVDTGHVFTLYDNLSVEVVPEPGSLAFLGLGAVSLLRRRRR
jgi:hypothetical protein